MKGDDEPLPVGLTTFLACLCAMDWLASRGKNLRPKGAIVDVVVQAILLATILLFRIQEGSVDFMYFQF